MTLHAYLPGPAADDGYPGLPSTGGLLRAIAANATQPVPLNRWRRGNHPLWWAFRPLTAGRAGAAQPFGDDSQHLGPTQDLSGNLGRARNLRWLVGCVWLPRATHS